MSVSPYLNLHLQLLPTHLNPYCKDSTLIDALLKVPSTSKPSTQNNHEILFITRYNSNYIINN